MHERLPPLRHQSLLSVRKDNCYNSMLRIFFRTRTRPQNGLSFFTCIHFLINTYPVFSFCLVVEFVCACVRVYACVCGCPAHSTSLCHHSCFSGPPAASLLRHCHSLLRLGASQPRTEDTHDHSNNINDGIKEFVQLYFALFCSDNRFFIFV